MQRSCVVCGCTRNTDKNPDLPFLRFPKLDKQRRQWIRFVDKTRSDFNLTSWSHICKEHFAEDCVDESVATKARFGIKCPFRLKPGAVPTLKAPTAASSTSRPAPVLHVPGTDAGIFTTTCTCTQRYSTCTTRVFPLHRGDDTRY